MTYRQLVTPNLDPIVYQYGSTLTDWLGWCLAVAWTAFGGETTSPTAWAAWTTSIQHQHPNEWPPAGVYVPIWFSGYGGSGHVAIYKDGRVWSSPYSHKATMDVLSSIAEVERIYGVTYAGWSEDIGSVRIVEPITQGEDMATPQQIDDTISVVNQVGWSETAGPEIFDNQRPLLTNNFVEGILQILHNADTDPNSAKNRIGPLQAENAVLKAQLASKPVTDSPTTISDVKPLPQLTNNVPTPPAVVTSGPSPSPQQNWFIRFWKALIK